MGLSALILVKKHSNIVIGEVIKDIEEICKKNSYYFSSNAKRYNADGKLEYVYANLSDVPFIENLDRQICFGIFDENYNKNYNYIDLDFNEKNDENLFYRLIIIEDFCENEDLLLKFTYEFLEKYKDAKLYTEFEWFYTVYDLNKIINSPYDNEWCYVSPNETNIV